MIKLIYLFVVIALMNFACEDSSSNITKVNEEIDISDWTAATHSNSGERNYDIVFPQDEVNRIDISIPDENWGKMLTDMAGKYGPFGSNQGGHLPNDSDEDPIYVPCSVVFNGIEWYKVGIRFRGNSSLKVSWLQGIWKIPLRLNFDRYEDDYPQINNQRFYGFKELALSSGYDDKSLMREKLAPEIFRDFDVPAPQTAFCRIYIDYGSGAKYFGLYTIVEVVDDTVIEEQFESDEGNCYKPEGPSASFAAGGLDVTEFENKTNGGDWSDIEALYAVLHSFQRTTNEEGWRDSLENIFNVDVFLRWLAVNITIQNWDTYGKMYHNYYLYNDPENNLLTWIPWDNNESLKTGKQGGALSVSCDEVGNNWPLIRFLLNNETYKATYKSYLFAVINDAFEPSKMINKYQYYHALISPYAIGPDGEQSGYTFLDSDTDFTSALDELISHVSYRYNAVVDYLN